MIFETCKKYQINQQTTPIFIYGRSFGGLIAAHMMDTEIGRSMFTGVILLSPFFKTYADKLEKIYKLIYCLQYVAPHKQFHSAPTTERNAEYAAKFKQFLVSPANVGFCTAQTGVFWM